MALDDIDHIVFLMLENRSFDHMLGYLSREDTPDPLPVDGLRADDTFKAATANYEAAGVPPHTIKRLVTEDKIDDPPHGAERVGLQIDTPPDLPGPRKMGGFVQTYIEAWKEEDKRRPRDAGAVMGYYDHKSVWAYDFLARHYCVCDRWFTPLPTGTQPNRLMAMGGDSRIRKNASLFIPRHDLVYDWLSRNGVDWAAYMSGGLLPFFALMPKWWDDILGSKLQRGKFRNFDRLRADWQSDREMPPVLFVEPAYSELRGDKANDDHAPVRIKGGQELVADLYDALTGNAKRWAKTLMIVTYDEHGGFFDHVPPLSIRKEFKKKPFTTTGPRVPALLVSPWVDAAQVFRQPVDHTAVLAMLAEKFTPGVPYSDAVAARQASYPGFGRLAAALQAKPQAGTPPALKRPPTTKVKAGIKSMMGLAPQGLKSADDAPDAGTPTALAFHRAARKTARKGTDLLAELDGVPTVAAAAPPVPKNCDHIGDE